MQNKNGPKYRICKDRELVVYELQDGSIHRHSSIFVGSVFGKIFHQIQSYSAQRKFRKSTSKAIISLKTQL